MRIKYAKSEERKGMHVIVPSYGMAVVFGKGIFRSDLYPGEYMVHGKIEGDSLLIKRWDKIERRRILLEWIDGFLRSHALYPQDYFFARALFLGERDKLLPQWKEWFKKSGNYHLLAISGLHTGILFLIISLFLSLLYIPRRFLFLLASLLIGVYGWTIGFLPSVKRAFLFLFIFSITRILQRRTPMLNILGLSMLITLIADPIEAFRAGFQLSYAATFGILYTFDYGGQSPIDKYIWNPLKIAFSAQLFTTPILLYHFGNAYPLFFPSSVITAPLTFLVMLNTVYALLLWPLLQMWASLHVMIDVFLHIVKMISSIPLPPLKMHIPGWLALSIILLETLAIYFLKRLKRLSFIL